MLLLLACYFEDVVNALIWGASACVAHTFERLAVAVACNGVKFLFLMEEAMPADGLKPER